MVIRRFSISKISIFALLFAGVTSLYSPVSAHAADCTPSSQTQCAASSPVNPDHQEVQTGSALAQKQALQNSSPKPSTSPSANAQNAQGTGKRASSQAQTERDWRPKTVQTCVKGPLTLQLKRAGACPRGFLKK